MLAPISQKPLTEPTVIADWNIQIVHGTEAVLRLQGELTDLSTRCGQPGALDHLEYFLRRPKFARKIPCLVLFYSGADGKASSTGSKIVGAVLLYQYQVAGIGCRIFAADYHAGDRTLVGPQPFRAQMGCLACHALLERGALVVQLTCPVDLPVPELHCFSNAKDSSRWRWAASVRMMNGHIPLADSYDETLSGLGKHTRRNLRASRRHAAHDLGYTFVVNPVMSKDEFVAFNRASTHPESDEMTVWRYEAMKLLPDYLFLGIKAANGEWLSLIGGRRNHERTIVEWQMNRAGLTDYSLSTLMRSHLLEHEVGRGCKRLYFVGGTSHTMKYSQSTEYFLDLVTLRYSLSAFFLRRFARPLMLEHAFLVQAVGDPKLIWNRWETGSAGWSPSVEPESFA